MAVSHWRPALALAGLALVVAACSARSQAQLSVPSSPHAKAAPHVAAATPAPPVDPIAALLADSERHFEAGQQEMAVGHLERARREFDRAIDVVAESPFGARYDVRLRQHFDRLVDQISAYELRALAEGDGFTEKRTEPASIDALLEQSTSAPAAASAATTRAVSSDLESTEHDVPIPLNARVLAYIELFQGRLHDWFAVGLQRGARYLPMIQEVFRAEGLPLDLAYVPLIESAFNPNAVSRAKAQGVWQFMAGTAGEHGLKRDWYIDERSDPEKATRAAASYLQTLVGTFEGDWHLALASYNGGPGLVQRAMKRSGLSDFWALADRPAYLPRETREYVPMILAAMVIARNPGQYGFETPTEAPLEYEKVKVSRPVDLRRIAEWADTDVSQIKDLNPELRRSTTPVRFPGYEIKVPKGKAATIEARLAELTPADTASLKWYTVKRGDTLATIAKGLRVNRAELAAANYLSAKALVTPGQNLVVPVEPALLLAGRPDRPAPAAENRMAVASTRAASPRSQAAAPTSTVKVTYEVKRGDTLFAVAKLYRTTIASLKTWNGLSGDSLTPGARLTIFAPRVDRRPRP
jgi:membrane-bound lytic murein transglycosylase D